MTEESTDGAGDAGALVRLYRWLFGVGYDRNVGGLDRTLRYPLGPLAVLAGLAAIRYPIPGGTPATVVLAVLLIPNGVQLVNETRTRYSPLYELVGRDTYEE